MMKKNAITCRPADLLEMSLIRLKEMKQWKQQDEDVLSYALFPQVATDFFKYRQAQQTKVDATVADTRTEVIRYKGNKKGSLRCLLWDIRDIPNFRRHSRSL